MPKQDGSVGEWKEEYGGELRTRVQRGGRTCTIQRCLCVSVHSETPKAITVVCSLAARVALHSRVTVASKRCTRGGDEMAVTRAVPS